MCVCVCGAGVAQQLCNELSRDGPWFDSRWERCKNRASRPSQGTVNGVPSLNDLAVYGTCIYIYIADASAHLLTKNKLPLFGDASVLNCRIYCEYWRTYAIIILQSRYTPNVRPISGNVH